MAKNSALSVASSFGKIRRLRVYLRMIKEQNLLANAERLEFCRRRQFSLAWFMRSLNLSPIRASIADNLEASSHTSALLRINRMNANTRAAKERLSPVNSSERIAFLPISTEDTLDLIDWTARLSRPVKHGKVAATEPPILRKFGLTHSQWIKQMLGTETRYWRALSSAQSMIKKAAATGHHWLEGTGSAETLMRSQPT